MKKYVKMRNSGWLMLKLLIQLMQRAVKINDTALYSFTIFKVTSIFFMTNHHNYARQMSFYFLDLTNLGKSCFFFSIWVFFHENARLTGQQGNGEAIFSTRLYHFRNFTDTQMLARKLLQRAHVCTQLAAGIEPGTFGFQAQVAKH